MVSVRAIEVLHRSVRRGGVGALAKRRHATLAKNFCNNIYLIQFIFVWLVGIDVFFPLKTHGHSDVTDRTVLVTVPSEGTSSTVQRARSQGRTGTSDRWHPPNGANCPPRRRWDTYSEPCVPPVHRATFQLPTQISTPSPKSSCAPSRTPCSAIR